MIEKIVVAQVAAILASAAVPPCPPQSADPEIAGEESKKRMLQTWFTFANYYQWIVAELAKGESGRFVTPPMNVAGLVQQILGAAGATATGQGGQALLGTLAPLVAHAIQGVVGGQATPASGSSGPVVAKP